MNTITGLRLCTSAGTGGSLPAWTLSVTSRVTLFVPSLMVTRKVYVPTTAQVAGRAAGGVRRRQRDVCPRRLETIDQVYETVASSGSTAAADSVVVLAGAVR